MTIHLYSQLTSWENLRLAYQKAAKGKRGTEAVARFEYRLEDNLIQLQAELVTQSYRPGRYGSFYIHEPKRRLISAAPFRDRVVHHALWAQSRDTPGNFRPTDCGSLKRSPKP